MGGKSNGTHAPPTQENRLLASIPEHELAVVESVASSYTATLRETLFEKEAPLTQVMFPTSALVSIITELGNGTIYEAITVGREGMVGLPLFHGVTYHRMKAICQIAGDFITISAEDFPRVLAEAPQLKALIHRYAQYSFEALSQYVACNSSHQVEQRCARWLLTTSDSLEMTTFSLTQEFLSQMLAVRRPGVTVAIGALDRQGLITHRYGSISLIDRDGLRKASCECYDSIRALQHELFSNPARGF